MTNLINRIRGAVANYKAYSATVRELQSLSDRELSDIGISRYDIRTVAKEAI